jgi:diguanylate cyclase (GGDEF)-like protein
MATASSLKVKLGRAQVLLDSLLQGLAMYLVPLGLVILTFVAVISWDGMYERRGGLSLPLQVLVEGEHPLTPQSALPQFDESPLLPYFETKRTEKPIWFLLNVNGSSQSAVEFPSRHAYSVACWDANSMELLGDGNRTGLVGSVYRIKAGFATRLPERSLRMVCRATFMGPARLTALQWQSSDLQSSADRYHRESGLLDGGLLLLAVFVALMSLINRQGLYVLFAVWLVTNLRVASISAGMDFQWLGQEVPVSWLPTLRAVTVTLHGLVTLQLFNTLFRQPLANLPLFRLPLQATQWMALPLLLATVLLPFKAYLPFMWLVTGLGLILMSASLIYLVVTIRTSTVLWYAASLGITLFSAMAEIIAAAIGKKEIAVLVNSVTGAIASSVLTAVAIAEQIRIEHRKRMQIQAKVEKTFQAMPVGLFSLQPDGMGVSANPAMYRMLGTNEAAFRDAPWSAWFGGEVWVQMYRLLREEGRVEMEIAGRTPGQRLLVAATIANGVIEGSLQDVTRQATATEHLRFLADHDPLTKILNRRGVERAFTTAAAETTAARCFILAYLDLDRFKLINDLFGHPAGDEVLRQVCQRAQVLLVEGQHFGRIGGDEFVLLMPDTTVQLAELICRGIIDSLSQTPFLVSDKAFQVRGSIGAIEVAPGMLIKDALSAADAACRAAKRKSGFFMAEREASVFREHEEELTLISNFSTGRVTEGLYIEMQPIMSLTNPKGTLNAEVLLRMRDANGKAVPVSRVLAAAETVGKTATIDRWVMNSTLVWLDEHLGKLERTKFICMNMSGASLNDDRFVQDALKLLSEFPQAAKRLCIEITEDVALHDLEVTSRFIHAVRKLGVRVALDDFGAGYTSFSYLKQLRADVVKIDGSFIVDINADPANVTIVEAIVTLARNLGMKTIAEWAEDAETVRTLASIGVDYVQGFAISRSQPREQFLTAQSAADFILDPPTRALVEEIASGNLNPLGQFTDTKGGLHLVQ